MVINSTKYATSKQASFMIEREMKKSSAKNLVLAEESDLSNVHCVSSLVITKNEETGDYGLQLEFLEQQRESSNGAYKTTTNGNPIWDKYIITGEQLDAYCTDSESKSKMYDMLSKYHKNNDILIRYGADDDVKRMEPYKGMAFSEDSKPGKIDGYKPTEYTDRCSSTFDEIYNQNVRNYKAEHPLHRIAFTLERCELRNPVTVTQEMNVDEIKAMTGIEPELESDGSRSYTTGYKMVQMIACDHMQPKWLDSNPSLAIPNAYLVNYSAKLTKDEPRKTYHDLLIDPSYATDLVKNSNMSTMIRDANGLKNALGVTRATVYYHNHAYTRDLTDDENKAIYDRDLRNQFTNEVLAEAKRPALTDSELSAKAPKGCTKTLNIKSATRPEEPFDKVKHNEFVGASVRTVQQGYKKGSQSTNNKKAAIKEAQSRGNGLLSLSGENTGCGFGPFC